MAETTPPTPDVPPVADVKVASVEAPVARRELRWYLTGFASVGLLVGFFAGLSDSPVVSTLLPLILATIGGTGGAVPRVVQELVRSRFGPAGARRQGIGPVHPRVH